MPFLARGNGWKKKWVIYNITSLLIKENNMFNKIPLNSNKIRSMHRLNCCKRPRTRRHKYYFWNTRVFYIYLTATCHFVNSPFTLACTITPDSATLPCSPTCDTSNLWILSRSIPFTYQCLLFSFRCGGGRDYTLVEKLWTAHYSQCWPGKSLPGHSRPRLNSHGFFLNWIF